MGDAKRSQSATFFTTFSKKNGEQSNQRPLKRPREEELTPTIQVSQASIATVEEPVNTNIDFNRLAPHKRNTYIDKEKVALKLNRLKDKNNRMESHRAFLSQCVDTELIPKGLELTLEPTIGNHDQMFLDNWFGKLKRFSMELMTDIVKFCEETITKTAEDITKTESALKSSMDKEEFEGVSNTQPRSQGLLPLLLFDVGEKALAKTSRESNLIG